MNQQTTVFGMNSKKLFLRFLTAFLVWAALSVMGYLYGDKVVRVLEPFYLHVIELAHPEYKARIAYDNNESEPHIELYVTALKSIPFAPGQSLAAGTTVGPTKITIFHTLVPMVIFGVIILVWPVSSIKTFVVLLLLAIPGLFIVTGTTAPFQMLGLLDTAFIQAAAQQGYQYQSGSYLWMRFTEGGARWLIPLLVGIVCGLLANRLAGPKTSA